MIQSISLEKNCSIEELNLSWNHLRLKGALAIANALQYNSTLRILDLSWNGFSDEASRKISNSLKRNRTLEDIDLSSNRISSHGADSLSESIHSSNLKSLKLSYNPIDAYGAAKFLSVIRQNVSSSQLAYLELLDVEVGDQFEKEYQELRRLNSNFVIRHGGRLRRDDIYETTSNRTPEVGDPLALFLEHARKTGMRLSDLFARFDRDRSFSLTDVELANGLKASGLILSDLQVEKLLHTLDTDKNGEVDFGELVDGVRRHRDAVRKRQKAMSVSSPGSAYSRRPSQQIVMSR